MQSYSLLDFTGYAREYKIPHHPLHAKGYPSIGDAKDTIPIPEDGSTRYVDFKFEGDYTPWLDYACERKGRFVGLANKDGSTKTECGIHVAGAEKTFDRDLWEDTNVKNLQTSDEASALKSSGKPAIVAVYAPWCQFCQAMEDDFAAFAKEMDGTLDVYKLRGDEIRDYVTKEYNTNSFPTINIVKEDGSVVKYESEDRSVDALKKFANDQLSVAA